MLAVVLIVAPDLLWLVGASELAARPARGRYSHHDHELVAGFGTGFGSAPP